MMNNNIYGNNNGFDALSNAIDNSTASFADLDYVKEDTKDELESVDIKSLLGKLSPDYKKKLKAQATKLANIPATEAAKENNEPESKEKKPEIEIDVKDKEMFPLHTVTAFAVSTEIERLADSLFSQIFTDYKAARLYAVDIPDTNGRNKTYVAMDLNFIMTPDPATDGKIKSVIPADDELNTKESPCLDEGVADIINTFARFRAIANQKKDFKLNNATREALRTFINPSVFVPDGKGGSQPDWKNIETCDASVTGRAPGQYTTNGEFMVTVKIDPVIFITKIVTLLSEITPDKYKYDIVYYAPINPTAYVNSNQSNGFRTGMPFLIAIKTTNIAEDIRIMRLTCTGRFGNPAGAGLYYPTF